MIYDRRSPVLYPAESGHECPLHLLTPGLAGNWKVVFSRGIEWLSRPVGSIGDTIAVRPDSTGDRELVLEYRGAATVSPRFSQRKPDSRTGFPTAGSSRRSIGMFGFIRGTVIWIRVIAPTRSIHFAKQNIF